MPPMTTPLDPSSAPNPYASMPPGTTPLDPAGPLPSDIFQSAAAVPTQYYSTGTFPTSENGFASAASVTMEPGPSKPSLWNSTTEGAGVMQSAPAPKASPTFPSANPFSTAGPKV